MKSAPLKLLFFFLLSVATLGSVTFISQYQAVSQQILQNADFSAGLNQWVVKKAGADAVTVGNCDLALHSSSPTTSVAVYQAITNRFTDKTVRLKALLRTRGVIAGEKPWNKARLLLVQYFDGKANWSLPHGVVALEGTNDWQEESNVFTIAPNCSEFRVVAQMSGCSGEFFLKDLSLYEVEETALYDWVKWLIRGAWIFFIIFLFVPYLKNGKIVVAKLPVFITVALILVGTTMPGTVKNELKKRIESELTGETSIKSVTVAPIENGVVQPDWLQAVVKEIDITKIAHFVLFALLLLVLRYNNPTRPVKLLMLDIFMLSCATEFSQFFVENRSPLFTDVIIDMAGGSVGLLLAGITMPII